VSCGIVDVPGHERFVKNMLAGACGVDAMMLVIAADEGVMPQTREHLEILDLLGVRRGLVALTKIDLVDPEWLELVTESVREYLDFAASERFPWCRSPRKTRAGTAVLGGPWSRPWPISRSGPARARPPPGGPGLHRGGFGRWSRRAVAGHVRPATAWCWSRGPRDRGA
jgi:selenocysteine-specific elongation factor